MHGVANQLEQWFDEHDIECDVRKDEYTEADAVEDRIALAGFDAAIAWAPTPELRLRAQRAKSAFLAADRCTDRGAVGGFEEVHRLGRTIRRGVTHLFAQRQAASTPLEAA